MDPGSMDGYNGGAPKRGKVRHPNSGGNGGARKQNTDKVGPSPTSSEMGE